MAFRLQPFVNVLEAVSDRGLPAIPPGGSTDPYVNTRYWSVEGLSDQSDPEAVYQGIVTGETPLQVKLGPPTKHDTPWYSDALIGLQQILGGYLSGGWSFVTQGLAIAGEEAGIDKSTTQLAANLIQAGYGSGVDAMAFFDDLSFDSFTDFAGSFVDEIDWGNVGSFALDTYQTFLPAGNQVQAIPVAASAKNAMSAAAGAIAKVGPAVGRTFFNKWPNLATAIQKMKNAGHNVSRSKLYSMLKRFGPEFLVTAGIMSAAAVSELILAGPGHRRMNPANSKALRRATRRIKSFHRLCGEADVIKTRRRSCAKKC
mgnify:CR=1 FL=1